MAISWVGLGLPLAFRGKQIAKKKPGVVVVGTYISTHFKFNASWDGRAEKSVCAVGFREACLTIADTDFYIFSLHDNIHIRIEIKIDSVLVPSY